MRAGFCLKGQSQSPLIRPSGTFSRKREKGLVRLSRRQPRAKAEAEADADVEAEAEVEAVSFFFLERFGSMPRLLAHGVDRAQLWSYGSRAVRP